MLRLLAVDLPTSVARVDAASQNAAHPAELPCPQDGHAKTLLSLTQALIWSAETLACMNLRNTWLMFSTLALAVLLLVPVPLWLQRE